jgi:hypothetical protein
VPEALEESSNVDRWALRNVLPLLEAANRPVVRSRRLGSSGCLGLALVLPVGRIGAGHAPVSLLQVDDPVALVALPSLSDTVELLRRTP